MAGNLPSIQTSMQKSTFQDHEFTKLNGKANVATYECLEHGRKAKEQDIL